MTGPNHILIVDDSPEDCTMYRRQLQQDGLHRYEFQVAHSAADGLKQCKIQFPDCVLLDFNLPDSDGLDFLTALRAEFGEKVPPVVMLTGQGNESVAVQAMKLGAQDYLVKGLKGDELRHAIQSAIHHIALRRKVEEQQAEVARLSAERAGLIEELERRAVALADADRRKNEFLAVLAHELRNPLGPIRNAAHLIRLNSQDNIPEISEIIDRQVGHMARLIDDLLDVSRIVRNKIVLRNELIDFCVLIRTIIKDHLAEFEQAGLTLTSDIPCEETWLNGDPTRLSQVLGNILDNSRKFTPAGGRVSIELVSDRQKRFSNLTVKDSGEGLDSATLERMFDVFSQADRSLDRSRGGLGLGLAIVKGIAELHGGSVVAQSEGPGRGCEISLSLPLAVRPKILPAKPIESAQNSFATSLRVLIVEDNQDAGDTLRMLLNSLGHEAVVARTGLAALESAKTFHPELIICDIGLTHTMSGYGVAQRFRADAEYSTTFLVALTGYGQTEDRLKAREAGFDLHLTKPITVEALIELPERVRQKSQSIVGRA